MEEEEYEETECEEDEDEDQDEDWWDKEEAEEVWGSEESTAIPQKRSKKIVETIPVTKSFNAGGSALEAFALAIQQHEGWFPPGGNSPKGSTSFRNNNPGNLKFVGQREATGKDERGFAIFPNYPAGLRALQFDIGLKVGRSPEWDFEDFFKVYAPSSDDNNPIQYALSVAKKLGVSPKTKLNVLFS